MSSRSTHTPVRPPAALQDIVERALAGDADSVSLEPVPEGLEVCWIVGNTGLGTVVSTEEGSRITRFIVRATGLEQHNRGVLAMEVAGESERFPWKAMSTFGSGGTGFGWYLLGSVAAHNPPLEPTARFSDE